MDRTTLAILTLVASVTMFVVSKMAQRTGEPNSKLHVLTRILRVVVLSLVAFYFYKRFTE